MADGPIVAKEGGGGGGGWEEGSGGGEGGLGRGVRGGADFLIGVGDVEVSHHEGDEGEEDGYGDRFGHHENKQHEQLRRNVMVRRSAGDIGVREEAVVDE